MTPLIGVTSGFRIVSSGEGRTRAHTLYTDFTTMVAGAGGAPVALVPVDDAEAIADRIDGLVLTGGGDVDPTRYGGTAHETVHGVEPERDEFEISLVRAVRDRGLPTLAICRGMQVLAVALGGTLVEDIPSGFEGAVDHRCEGEAARRPAHPITLVEGSRLAETIGATELEVNSVHHQAVRTPGDHLTVTAWAPDGVIEGLQHGDEAWPMWAVQWHPEWMPGADSSKALFSAVVAAARGAAVAR